MPIAPGIADGHDRQHPRARIRHPETLQHIKSHGRRSSLPSWSSRCKAAGRNSSRANSCRSCAGSPPQSDTALVFDEVVTGFRVHPGGAQALFGIRPTSRPMARSSAAACRSASSRAARSTWTRSMAARGVSATTPAPRSASPSLPARSCATRWRSPRRAPCCCALKQDGPELQRGLNLRTTAFVEGLRKRAAGAACAGADQSFLFVVLHHVSGGPAACQVFFASMREKGVHIWEGRPCFLTLAHSEADLEHVATAFRNTIQEMQSNDFLPGRAAGARKGRDASGKEAWFVPDPTARASTCRSSSR